MIFSTILKTLIFLGIQYLWSVTSTDDEFEAVPEVKASTNWENSQQEQLQKTTQEQEIEMYKNLSYLGKLHFQLRRSGDISGKYDISFYLLFLNFI